MSLAADIADRYTGAEANFNDGPTRRALIAEVATAARTETLDAIAERLYDAQWGWQTFAVVFSREELDILAGLCTMQLINGELTGGRSYDDEVFDALANTADTR